ncbi:unnamed protein product [Arabis nemorensis]|uniref:Uncharacterized protein n=1 Tax=Arabis nemorensis TaxID=586526 RepID=A0A565BI53_9BRAS|nr:unnamed protein product [Arabis nemorensis]
MQKKTSLWFQFEKIGVNQNKKEAIGEGESVLKKDVPLFGVLTEEQVGINPATGRPRIHPDLLEGMRIYLLADLGMDRVVKESIVKNSIEPLKNAPNGQDTLTLGPGPIISTDLDKWKGIVFCYEQNQEFTQRKQVSFVKDKLMQHAIQSG